MNAPAVPLVPLAWRPCAVIDGDVVCPGRFVMLEHHSFDAVVIDILKVPAWSAMDCSTWEHWEWRTTWRSWCDRSTNPSPRAADRPRARGRWRKDGQVDHVIRERMMENARLLSAVPLDQVPSMLTAADALVKSYRTTSVAIPGMIGSKLYEDCAAGKPILVHGTGVAADLVQTVGQRLALRSE